MPMDISIDCRAKNSSFDGIVTREKNEVTAYSYGILRLETMFLQVWVMRLTLTLNYVVFWVRNPAFRY